MAAQQTIYATGKRKSAIARTWLKPGTGRILINNRSMEEYFGRETACMVVRQPFQITSTLNKYDVVVTARGGGISGQAGAVKHGISKALLQVNPEFRTVLKRAGFLTRDDRVKERKKYGLRGARARYQYSKR